MYTLTIVYPVWTIDYETFRGKGHSFNVNFGPFSCADEAKWFWIMMKEKMKRNYEFAIILDKDGNECYVDEMGM